MNTTLHFPPDFKTQDLTLEGLQKQLQDLIVEVIKSGNHLKAGRWYVGMPELLDSVGRGELKAGVAKELAQLRYLSIPDLEEEEVAAVMSTDFALGCQIPEYDPWVTLRTRLSLFPYAERNIYKSGWLKLIHENAVALTSKPIVVVGASVSPTVMNWIKDYDFAVGGLGPADGLKKTQYVFRSKNVLATSEPERVYVKKLIDVYENLKLDSLTPGGVEQSGLLLGEDQRFKRIIDGVMYDLESGLTEVEYRQKFVPLKTPVASTPTTSTVSVPPKKPIPPKLKPPVPPLVPVAPTPRPVVKAKPVVPVRVAAPVVTPLLVVPRPSPAAASPLQTPQLTGSLPTGSTQPTSGSLVFSDEDEKEVANITQAQKVFFKAPVGIDYDFVAKKVMGRHKLFFESYDLERRFSNLVVSYVKGVRDEAEFRDVMTRPENTGGLNLSGDTTDKILLTIEEETSSAPQAKAQKFSSAGKSQLTPSLGQMKKAMDQTKAGAATITPTGEMVAKPKAASAPKARLTPMQPILPVTPTPQKNIPISPSAIRAPLDAYKPMMTDIKLPSKVMGPVDELANLTVQEFRRLGATPQSATEKLKSKIDILEGESLLKRSEGIRAWQHSPVNQLYLLLGQESLSSGRSVEDVLQQRQLSQQASLTKQEFDAIADLNRRLRY